MNRASRFLRSPAFAKLVILCIATILPSCLDSEEEVWLNADASGAARIRVSLPAAAATLHGCEPGVKKLITEYFEATPVFSSYLVETKTENNRLTFNVACTFDNALDLLEVNSGPAAGKLPDSAIDFMGKTEVAFRGLNMDFHRRIDLTKLIPGVMFIPQNQLSGHSLSTTIHLPKAAASHNATSSSDGGRTLVWTTPLSVALRAPVEIAYTMPLPIPWAIISFVVFLVFILAAVSIYYFYRRRKNATANPE